MKNLIIDIKNFIDDFKKKYQIDDGFKIIIENNEIEILFKSNLNFKKDEFLDKKIWEVYDGDLNDARIIRCLASQFANSQPTLRDIISKPSSFLKNISNFGKISQNEFIKFLKRHNLKMND